MTFLLQVELQEKLPVLWVRKVFKQNFNKMAQFLRYFLKALLDCKVMVSSGESNPDKIKKLGSKVLGVGWNPTSDKLNFNFGVSLVSKEAKTIISVTKENFLTFDRTLLTSRNLLRIVKSQYDPLGLAAPVTVRLRIAFRNVFRSIPNLEWDTPL